MKVFLALKKVFTFINLVLMLILLLCFGEMNDKQIKYFCSILLLTHLNTFPFNFQSCKTIHLIPLQIVRLQFNFFGFLYLPYLSLRR